MRVKLLKHEAAAPDLVLQSVDWVQCMVVCGAAAACGGWSDDDVIQSAYKCMRVCVASIGSGTKSIVIPEEINISGFGFCVYNSTAP